MWEDLGIALNSSFLVHANVRSMLSVMPFRSALVLFTPLLQISFWQSASLQWRVFCALLAKKIERSICLTSQWTPELCIKGTDIEGSE